MFILIDNYDSFTWNLWHFLSDLGADVEIIRNDACAANDIIARRPQGVIISPGPGTPEDAGMTIELITLCHKAGMPFDDADARGAVNTRHARPRRPTRSRQGSAPVQHTMCEAPSMAFACR